ncbi:MAG: hypothetical protein ABW154_08330 [Dyella sp.]
MTDSDMNKRPYQRPVMLRAVDPQRMNWLWRLVVEVADLKTTQVVDALHAAGVGINAQRVESWSGSDQGADFFPLSIAELERNLRSVLALRHAEQEVSVALQDAAGTPHAAASEMPRDGDVTP